MRRKTSTVKQLYRQLQADGTVEYDPAAVLVFPTMAGRDRAPPSPSELEAIAKAADSPAWLALLLVLVDTGVKRDEVVALRTGDVELPPEVTAPGRLRVRHRRATWRDRHRTLVLTDRLAEALVPLVEATRARVDDANGAPLPGLSARGVNVVVETCGRRAGVRTDQKVTPQMLREGCARTRMRGFMALEVVLSPDSRERRELERENNRLLLRELGLSDRSAAAVRFRSLARGLELDRAEQP